MREPFIKKWSDLGEYQICLGNGSPTFTRNFDDVISAASGYKGPPFKRYNLTPQESAKIDDAIESSKKPFP